MQPRRSVYLVLGIGVFAVGWAAIFIRLADAPALSTAAFRLAFASAPVAGYAALRHRADLRRLRAAEWWLLAGSGAALAVHFAAWIASLHLTTVASSVALVTTQPLWAALIAAAVLGERVTRGTLLAIVVATAGGALIGVRDFAAGGEALWGDALALVGAVCAAIYFTIGRRLRAGLDLAAYIGVVYPAAALLLLATAALGRQPLAGFPAETWLMFLLLALVPQLVGHSSLNWAVRYLPAHVVTVALLGEPVISTLLAIPFLGEEPGLLRAIGGAVTLVGVYLAIREEVRRGASGSAGASAHGTPPPTPAGGSPGSVILPDIARCDAATGDDVPARRAPDAGARSAAEPP
jgi:drug/metabolite transporter (DMT)-like permease